MVTAPFGADNAATLADSDYVKKTDADLQSRRGDADAERPQINDGKSENDERFVDLYGAGRRRDTGKSARSAHCNDDLRVIREQSAD